MRWMCLANCAMQLILVLWCPLGATAQEAAGEQSVPRLADFSQGGPPEVRQMLHGRQRYREVRTYCGKQPKGAAIRELVAVEPTAAGAGGLVLVTYDGLYLCGSHGCRLEALYREPSGRWRTVLDVVSQPGLVGLGPESANGFTDIVLPGDHSVGFRCPVWRYNGSQYHLERLMDTSQEPCQSLNKKGEGAASH